MCGTSWTKKGQRSNSTRLEALAPAALACAWISAGMANLQPAATRMVLFTFLTTTPEGYCSRYQVYSLLFREIGNAAANTDLGLAKPVRSVAFSPGNTRLAAAGDAGIIAVYDMKHGEHVGNLTGHSSWITSVDWSDSGEFLLSSSMDGKVKVWSIERNACVATHSETDKVLWAAKWLPKTGKSEMFCTAGANRSISFYREATGI
jgi:WD40 repeat protein